MTTVPFPDEPPLWATDGGTILEPSPAEKAAGWGVNERPPARWQNWYQNNVYAHTDHFRTMMRQQWTREDYPNAGFLEYCYHKGAFYGLDAANEEVWRSRDGRAWRRINAGPIATQPDGFLSTDDTTIVASRGAADFAQFSADDGQTWAACAGLVASAFGNTLTYFPNAGIWAGFNGAGVGVQSVDGQTWVGNTAAGSGSTKKWAENNDGSDLRIGDSFSTDQGGSWAAQTNIPNGSMPNYYFWSGLRGTFLHVDRNFATPGELDFWQSSGTPGDWDLAPYLSLVAPFGGTFQRVDRMWECRGAMYLAVEIDADNETYFGLMVSTDGGNTWPTFIDMGTLVLMAHGASLSPTKDVGLQLIQIVGLSGAASGLSTLPFSGIQP